MSGKRRGNRKPSQQPYRLNIRVTHGGMHQGSQCPTVFAVEGTEFLVEVGHASLRADPIGVIVLVGYIPVYGGDLSTGCLLPGGHYTSLHGWEVDQLYEFKFGEIPSELPSDLGKTPSRIPVSAIFFTERMNTQVTPLSQIPPEVERALGKISSELKLHFIKKERRTTLTFLRSAKPVAIKTIWCEVKENSHE